jgi:4a-hydroxytetrahydrobiopterin dehydratase
VGGAAGEKETVMARELLSQQGVDAALVVLHPDWTGTTQHLQRSIEFADAGVATDFVNQVGPISDEMDHHADMALRWRWVDIDLSTHSAGGVTELDLALAQRIDEVATTLTLSGDTPPD